MHPVALHSRVVCHLGVWTGVQRLREWRAEGGAVLMYHGVVARERDPLLDEHAIGDRAFRSHLEFFRGRYEVVPLRRIVDRVAQGEPIPARWIAITLDDALANQLTTAAAILAEGGFPWALAVPAGLIGTGRSIWSYELRLLMLECWRFPSIPSPLVAEELPTRTSAEKRAALRAIIPALFDRVDDEHRRAYLEGLIDQLGRDEFMARLRDDGRFTLATWEELARLRAAGVELLSHGWHHRPQNATIRRQALVQEIADSRRVIAERIGEPPAGFALPHGAKSAETDHLIEEAGYAFCLSSRPRRVGRETKTGDIPRFAAEYPLAVLRRQLLRH